MQFFGLLRAKTIILLKKKFKNFETGCTSLGKKYLKNFTDVKKSWKVKAGKKYKQVQVFQFQYRNS